MSRRIHRNDITEIAGIRIDKLIMLAKEHATHGDIDLARRYIDLARRISMRTRTKIPKEHIYCKNCFTPMTPGTFRVRLGPHRIVMVCLECGSVKRIPYVKEQKG